MFAGQKRDSRDRAKVFRAGGMPCTGGIQDRRDAGQAGFRTGGIQDRWDAGLEGCRTGEMKDWRDTGQVGCRTGWM